MNISALQLKEFNRELANTRKLLAAVPFDRVDYQPHEKSMSLGRLANHIVDLHAYVWWVVKADGYDVASGEFKPAVTTSNEDLLALLEDYGQKAITAMEGQPDEYMLGSWKMKHGEQLISDLPRMDYISELINHTVHHRGQLSVYLRMLDIAVPGTFGPSADEMPA